MEITPVSSSDSFTTDASSSSASSYSTTSSSTSSVDKQSTYSNDIASGSSLSIKDFSSIVLVATNTAQKQAWEIQRANDLIRVDIYKSLSITAQILTKLYNLIVTATSIYAKAYNANITNQVDLNDSVNNYNGGVATDAARVNTLNLAIDNYNTALTNYNGAVNTYNAGIPYPSQQAKNAALATLNNAYTVLTNNYSVFVSQQTTYNNYANLRNQTISATNVEIQTYNTQTNAPNPNATNTLTAQATQLLASSNLPTNFTVPQTEYGIVGVDNLTISNVPVPSTSGNSLIGNITNPSFSLPNQFNSMNPQGGGDGSTLANIIYSPIASIFTAIFGALDSTLNISVRQASFMQFYLNNLNPPYLPPSFVTPVPKPQVGSGGGSGTGSGSGVSLSTLVTSLSNPLMESIISQGKFTNEVTNINYQNASRLTTQLQILGLQYLAQLGLVAGASATDLLKGKLETLDLGASGVAAVAAASLLHEIVAAVSSGSFLSSIQAILAQTFPNLSAADLNALSTQLATSSELFLLQNGLFQLGQAFKTPQLFGQVLSTVGSAKQLDLFHAQLTASDVLHNSISSAAIKASVANNLANEANIQQSVAQSYINQSLRDAYVNGEVNDQAYVDSLVQKGITQQQALHSSSILHANINAEISSHGVLEQSVASNRLSHSTLSNELVNQIITGRPAITNRELRDELVNRFVSNGATPAEAIGTATTLVAGNSVGAGTASPGSISNSLFTSASHALSTIGFSVTESQAFARQLVANVIGQDIPGSQPSIRSLIDERLSALNKLQDNKITDNVKDSFLKFLAPSRELYDLADKIRDPANTFLLSAQTGMMYSHSQPSNYLKNVDINV